MKLKFKNRDSYDSLVGILDDTDTNYESNVYDLEVEIDDQELEDALWADEDRTISTDVAKYMEAEFDVEVEDLD